MISVNRLRKIALQPEYWEEYDEIMIKEEILSKTDGYLNRITVL